MHDNPLESPLEPDEITASNLQELRRGTVVLACLTALREPSYGYALLDFLAERGMPVDANTLYPLLRRLEKQGLLTSEWNTDEARPRKFYRTSAAGNALALALVADWKRLDAVLRDLADEADSDANASIPDPSIPDPSTAAPARTGSDNTDPSNTDPSTTDLQGEQQ